MDIIVLKPGSKQGEINQVVRKIEELGLKANVSKGSARTIIGAIGDTSKVPEERENAIKALPFVEEVMRILKPYRLASREFKKTPTVVKVGGKQIGGKKFSVIAGPCAVEARDRMLPVSDAVKKAGAAFIRGGAFKPRTSPYAFQGLGEEGLKIMKEASDRTGLPIVSEIMDPRDLPVMEKYVDIIQIGARNMQNFRLLLEVGKSRKPILLKRGLSSTIKEWLMAAEYIMSEGNHKVILCERGIRTFETATRNTLDLGAVSVLKDLSHLPVIVDPSHAAGLRELVIPMSRAALAAGADGLLIEVHINPEEAYCDGDQSLSPQMFKKLMSELKPIAKAMKKEI